MEKSWKITLSDGTTLEDLSLNGNVFTSSTEVTEDTFEGKLSSVTFEGTIDGVATTQTCENMELIQITQSDDKYSFSLREKSRDEIKQEELESEIDYLSMMTDVDLEV